MGSHMADVSLKQIEQLVDELSFEEQLSLLGHLTQGLRQKAEALSPQDLYGLWKGCFPNEFDLDATLRDIRSQWHSRTLQESEL